MKVTIDFFTEYMPELVELYNETARLFTAAGLEPWSIEKWYANMLTFGSTPHVVANARLLNEQTRRKYNIETGKEGGV